LEDWEEDAEVADSEESLTTNTVQWIKVVSIEELLFDNKLGGSETLRKEED